MNSFPVQVLLVEDNPADAGLMRRILARAGREAWQMAHFEQLDEAIDACGEYVKLTQGKQFDVALLDLNLPDSVGLKTIQRFCQELPCIPIVVLTGLGDEQTALQAIKNGAQDYLVKDETTTRRLLQAMTWAIARKGLSNLTGENPK
jgi:CheY-like chemotaxis protein